MILTFQFRTLATNRLVQVQSRSYFDALCKGTNLHGPLRDA